MRNPSMWISFANFPYLIIIMHQQLIVRRENAITNMCKVNDEANNGWRKWADLWKWKFTASGSIRKKENYTRLMKVLAMHCKWWVNRFSWLWAFLRRVTRNRLHSYFPHKWSNHLIMETSCRASFQAGEPWVERPSRRLTRLNWVPC